MLTASFIQMGGEGDNGVVDFCYKKRFRVHHSAILTKINTQ
jgi:hypothetical protein